MCHEAQSSLSPFPTPCARNATCLVLEGLMWMDAPRALTTRLHHYHHLTCLKNMFWMLQSKLKELQNL